MRKLLWLAAILLTISSCKNLVPYTDALRKNNNWSDKQVMEIQFYTSNEIVLYRELTQGSTEIVSGKIKKVNGRDIEEIVIRPRTPGVVVSIPSEKKMYVSFEIGDDHYLTFGVNPERQNKYVLLASEWKNREGKVTYSGKTFSASAQSAETFLMVDLRKILKENVNARVAKGRKVN